MDTSRLIFVSKAKKKIFSILSYYKQYFNAKQQVGGQFPGAQILIIS